MSDHSLTITDLTVSYHRVPALHHVHFAARCGQIVALLGPNGAGKTTLLKTIAGLLRPEAGTIRFHGRTVSGPTTDFAYLPQREQVDWDFPLTVRGLVEMGRYLRTGWGGRFRETDAGAVDRALEAMHLEDFAHRQISALSGGQQQRAFLARSLAQEAHVFLLDEPFNGLDEPARNHLSETMRSLAAEGKLIMASHHDLATVPTLFSHVLLLNGERIASGTVAEAFTPAHIEKTYHTGVYAGPSAHHHHHHHHGLDH